MESPSLKRIFFCFAINVILSVCSVVIAQDSATPPEYYYPQISSTRTHTLIAPDSAKSKYDILLIEDLAPWNSTANINILNANGISFKKIAMTNVIEENLSDYKKIIIAGDQTTSFYVNYMTNKYKFDSFVNQGGVLEWHACGFGWNQGDSSSVVLPGGVSLNRFGHYLSYNDIAMPSHVIVNGVPSPFYGSFASHGYFTNFTDLKGIELITTQGETEGYWPTLIQYSYGKGCVLASSQPLEFGYEYSQATGTILSNMIPYDCLQKKKTEASQKGGSPAFSSGLRGYRSLESTLHGLSHYTVQDYQKGYVVIIDGMNIRSVLNSSYSPVFSRYLYDAVDPRWFSLIENEVGTLTYFSWSRDIWETDEYVFMLSAVLEGYSNLSKKNKSPLVVLTHSWGSVLAYIAMSRNSDIKVDKFITLGSPLVAQNELVHDFTKETLARWGIDRIRSLSNVKRWVNYWGQCDKISGSIPALKENNIMITSSYSDDIFGTCHAAYYGDYSEWQLILLDVYLTKFIGPETFSTCNTLTPENFYQPAYNNYGAPFDLFGGNAMLVDAKCSSSDKHTIKATLGIPGNTTRLVYMMGYYYDHSISKWKQYTPTCNGTINRDWCVGSATANITDPNISTDSASAPTFFVGYVCSLQNGQWKCGCRDATCAKNYWQLQGAGR